MDSNRYETMIVFVPELDDAKVQEQIERILVLVSAHSGTIESQENWGRRKLAYKIGKKDFGIYVLLVLNGDAKLVADLDRQLKINDQVLRHLTVCKDKHAPDAAPHLKESGEAPVFVTREGRDFDEEEDGAAAV